jgi:hypothetical protein
MTRRVFAGAHEGDLLLHDISALTSIGGDALPAPEIAAAGITAVVQAALATPHSLKMTTWHECETTHCAAGWGTHQAGAHGKALEALHGPATAGALLLGVDMAHLFFETDAIARVAFERMRDYGEAPRVARAAAYAAKEVSRAG